MQASGCMYRSRSCEFPKDKHADISPVVVEAKLFRYYSDWDGSWRQSTLEIRQRSICNRCREDVVLYLEDLIQESNNIEEYYSRKDGKNEGKRKEGHRSS